MFNHNQICLELVAAASITYMYHRSSSSSVEAMNAANYSIRQQTSVDVNNAVLFVFQLECRRFGKQQLDAWSVDSVLSPRGDIEFEESFNQLHYHQFRITVTEREDMWECLVKRIKDKGPERTVTISKSLVKESYFGKCTCRVDEQDAVPCEHMAVVAVSSRLSNVTRYKIMPY